MKGYSSTEPPYDRGSTFIRAQTHLPEDAIPTSSNPMNVSSSYPTNVFGSDWRRVVYNNSTWYSLDTYVPSPWKCVPSVIACRFLRVGYCRCKIRRSCSDIPHTSITIATLIAANVTVTQSLTLIWFAQLRHVRFSRNNFPEKQKKASL